MSETLKKLDSSASPGGPEYTAPTNVAAIVSNITITNSDSVSRNFAIYVHGNSDPTLYDSSDAVYYEASLDANSTIVLDPGFILDPGKTVKVGLDSVSMSASIFGSEVTPPAGYKFFGKATPDIQSNSDVYNNTNSEKVGLVRSIALCNQGDVADYINIAISPSENDPINEDDYVAWNFKIEPKETVLFSSRYQVEYNNKINVYSEEGSTNFFVFGVEV